MKNISFNNLNCPACGNHVVFKKFLYTTVDKHFNCMYCSQKIIIKERISARAFMYCWLLFLIPTFFFAITTKHQVSFILLAIEFIIPFFYLLKGQQVVLLTIENKTLSNITK
jgi:DNA-directed RNA polymerase subunit RPC12/RpoP